MNRNDINEIFNAVGGKRKLIAWAKKSSANYAQLLSMLGRDVLQDADPQHAVDPQSGEQLSAMALAAMEGVISKRVRESVPDGAANPPIRKTIDVSADPAADNVDVFSPLSPIPQSIDSRIGHGVSDTPHGIAETPAPQPLLTQSNATLTSHMPDVVKRKAEPTVPGAGAAQALNGRSDGQHPSATELFLQWSDSARATWEAPKGWGGS